MQRNTSRALIGVLAIALVAMHAGAQQHTPSTRDSVARLPGVHVHDARAIARSGGASALELSLDSLRLEPAPTLDRVLRDLPFVQVRVNPRGESYFTNRGSGADAREVAVLIDGVPASLNFDDRADLALIPVTAARTLTLVRGLPSLLYGPNVLGGLVDLGIASGARDIPAQRASMTLGADATGARAVSGAVAMPVAVGAASYLRVGGGYRRSDGYALPRGVTEPAPNDGDDRRLNSDREQGDAFLATRIEGQGGGWASLSSMFTKGRHGTPAELGSATPQLLRFPLLQRSFSVLTVGTGNRASPFGGRGALQLGAGFDAGRTTLDGYTTRTYATVRNHEEDVDRNASARLVASQTIGDALLSSALTYANVRRHEALSPGATSTYRQRLWSGATELGWSLPAMATLSTIRATVGAAYDGSDTPETGDKPVVTPTETWGGRMGVTATAREGMLLLHAGMSRRVRFPALREMYSGTLASVEPNPDLRPEVLVAAEAGATARLGEAQVQVVAFHNRITDAIVRTTVNKKVKRANRDRTIGTGLELLGSLPVRRATLSADLTAQSIAASDASTDQDYQVEYQPKFAGGVHASAALPLATSLDVGVRAVGSQYCASAQGYQRIDPSTRVTADVGRRWTSLEASVGLDNVTDVAIYDQCGLPQQGRTLRFQVRVF